MERTTQQPDDNAFLKTSAAETADVNGTALSIGPLGPCEVVVNATAGFGAHGTIQIKIQESSDNDSSDHFAHVENELAASFVFDHADFTVPCVIWRHKINSTKQYIRYTATRETSSGAVSITYSIFLQPIRS